VDLEGHAQGYYQATGIRPRALERLASAGIYLPTEMFERRTMNP
jgi:hypothetical protein